LQVVANFSDKDNPLLSSFDGETAFHLWRDCCEAAVRCCEKVKMADKHFTAGIYQSVK
jgi:hypothetical protein